MIEKTELQRVISKGELSIGGSFKHKDNFKDIDIFLILPDLIFEKEFLSADKWIDQRETGNWGPEMFKFREYSLQSREIIENRLATKHKVDFWIVPESFKNGENR